MIRPIADDFWPRFWSPLTLHIWIVASVTASLAGPFGTFESMALGLRSLFWWSLIAVSLVLSFILASAVRVLLPDMSEVFQELFVVVAFSLLFTPLVRQAVLLTSDGEWRSSLSWPVLGLSIMAITAGVATILRQVRAHVSHRGATPPMSADAVAVPRLIRRLDGVDPTQIRRLTVEDHYVVVILASGARHRLLMRFSDAVDEMEGVAGYCVHRSHWVVRSAITGVVVRGGREMVTLQGGDMVPVSRTYRRNLVDAGLIVKRRRPAAGSVSPDAR